MRSNKGGAKHDTGKPRLELISTVAAFKKAQILGLGAEKYGINDWRKGIAWSRLVGAALRHIFLWLDGEDNDAESRISHLAHAACSIDFLLEYEKTHRELDDRYRRKHESKRNH